MELFFQPNESKHLDAGMENNFFILTGILEREDN